VVAAVATGLLTLSNGALAAVSDPASPGDLLYPLDRAYERLADIFGDNDRAAERLDEAEVLATRGDSAGAMELAAEALEDMPGDAELAEAAGALSDTSGQVATAQLHEETVKLVDLAQQVVAAAHDDPEAVAALARQMKYQAQKVAEAARAQGGPPEETSSTVPEEDGGGGGGQGGRPEDPGAPGSTAPGRDNQQGSQDRP
jgi:hypothetical protein